MATRTKKATKKAASKKASKKAASKKAPASKQPAHKKAASKKAPAKAPPAKKPARQAAKKVTQRKASAKKKMTFATKAAPKPDTTAVDPAVLEFIDAIDKYKHAHQRPFPTWSEILHILRNLGYAKQ